MHNRILQLAYMFAAAALAWPSPATGKQGAMLDPRLLALPLGQATRAQLLLLPVYRNGPFGPRQMIPAPAVGSVSVLTVSLPGAHLVLHFTGTPLDRDRRSFVWITLPVSVASHRWRVWVRAGGHLYPDLIDSSESDRSPPLPTAVGVPPPAIRLPRPSRVGASPAWPLLVGGLWLAAAAAVVALVRARRADRMPRRSARR